MIVLDNTKGRFRLSLDFGPLKRLLSIGARPRTLLIAALALFLIIASVYAVIARPTLFRPSEPQPGEPGQFGPGSTDRTCLPTAGASGPAVPVTSGGTAAGQPGTSDAAAGDSTAGGSASATAQPAVSPSAAAGESAPQPAAAAPAAPAALAWPLRGKTLAEFGIIQSVTLGDWRQHDGIDIQAVRGASVTAAADGVVTSVEKRSDIGTTVVIDHGGGLSTVYGCLLVTGRKVGDRVKAGDEIGKAGNSGLFEVGLGEHLHFEVRRDGTALSPGDWLKQP